MQIHTTSSADESRRDPVGKARRYVDSADLPPARHHDRGTGAAEAVLAKLDAAKEQAAIVGSDVVSFVKGVTTERRAAIINSSTLAQLVAKKKVPDFEKTKEWYEAYFDVLTNIGWVLQDRSFATFEEKGSTFETHKAIITVATGLLGPAAPALALLITTLNALQSMNDSSPWITLFSRESQSARTGRFQVSLVEQDAESQFFVTLMAFGLTARDSITQVLFFKARASDVTLQHASGRVSINTTVLDGVSDALKTKIVAHAADFVKTLPDL